MKYSKIKCPKCDGRGWVLPEMEIPEQPSESVEMLKCNFCDGEREIFVSPFYS
ncbi:hypothetical protein [Paenibacillus naphthalenovorans]|uniref:hypothetical protein n=1 Tax=Paenibacillus naphthalenovorans TaxID=162209 RepID=UPI0015870F42|nr:hypothetical protein [Paenibacillus naphthalenovorans]